MNPVQIKVRIISNKRLRDNYGFANRKANHGFPTYWHLVFESGVIARCASPGQFVNIRVSDGFEPLLRRPISIHRARRHWPEGRACLPARQGLASYSQSQNTEYRGQIEILYEVIGRGTQLLSQRKPGELLDIIGPLGNGFDLTPNTYNLTPILVAGGMGVAPLVFLAEKLTKPRTQNLKPRTLVLIGAKTKAKVLCAKEFKEFGCEVKIATDNGSCGFKGKVTDLLKEFLLKNSRTQELTNSIYACGPQPMLKAVAEIARENRINSQLSLEEHMACGIGACSGCVVKVRSQKSEVRSQRVNEFEYKRVCKEGPVFKADEIIWEN